ncbi:hypothetical protein FGO68_gene3561 [Halteria grandinella]|uniref:Uncharacterized protein n=1 Tax=Halteria grandinella TaxID=5974 RepID=A0A8J8T393_HALGN|nr:hypothetical protein FGO68_gene3561 [Halteria grandinella]
MSFNGQAIQKRHRHSDSQQSDKENVRPVIQKQAFPYQVLKLSQTNEKLRSVSDNSRVLQKLLPQITTIIPSISQKEFPETPRSLVPIPLLIETKQK